MSPIDEDTRLARLRAVYEAQKASGEETGAIDAELLHDAIVWVRSLRDRVSALEQGGAEVVPALPAAAPAGHFLVMAGDTNLYIGAGANRPLRKIATQVV